MEPEIRILPEKKLLGMKMKMSMLENKTALLWKSFMTRRKEIMHAIGSDLYSLQSYPDGYFANYNPATEFEKWAATEISDDSEIPEGMEIYNLEGGMYAVFQHKGGAATGPKIFQYILGVWLPSSEYNLDLRPHFELLGEKYKNNDPDSEEEIWIPVKKNLP